MKGLRTGAVPQPKLASLVKAIGQQYETDFKQAFMDARQEHSIRPLMQVVASMPKEELAVLAEALINLTALKRKASRDQETVGGPTDVAVISKGDGFIWIKRKHYFDPGLNMDFKLRTQGELE